MTEHAAKLILPPRHQFWEAGIVTTNVVNLDAMIPRDDFAIDETPSKSTPLDRINIVHLDGHFFAGDLRKPDFQREKPPGGRRRRWLI